MTPPSLDLDPVARELVTLYRHAVGGASRDDASAAAHSLSRALEAIQRAKRSLRPESAYEIALADIADARRAMVRLASVSS